MKRLLTSVLVALASGTASSAPLVLNINAGYSFDEYTGSAAVGRGDVNTPSTLFYIDEKTSGGVKSWYLFFDPGRPTQELWATIHFDQPIAAVLTTKTDLDATNATHGASTVSYGTSRYIGLEDCPLTQVFCDAVFWTPGGHDLRLDWSAVDPGDHVRVLVAIPEPPSYLMLGLGLFGLGLSLHRRRR